MDEKANAPVKKVTMDESFDQLADQVTDGLKADPELRLDIRAEVLAHLEDAAAHAEADGTPPEESAATAVKAFGAPLDIAAALLDANTRRMAWRARLRLLISMLLIPLAVLVAVGLVYGRIASRQHAASMNVYGFDFFDPMHVIVPYGASRLPWFPSRCERNFREAKQVMDRSFDGWKGRTALRAYWEQHRDEPGSITYLGYYCTMGMGVVSRNISPICVSVRKWNPRMPSIIIVWPTIISQ